MIDTNLEKIGIFRSVPFRYLDMSEGSTKAPQIISYANSRFFDVAENAEGPRPVRIRAVFLGAAAKLEKIAFLKVARAPGTGTLIHPDVGVATAMCTVHDVSIDGTVDGIVAVDCEFLIMGSTPTAEIAYAAATAARAAAVEIEAVSALAAVQAPYGSAAESSVRADTVTMAALMVEALSGQLVGLRGAQMTALLGRASTADDVAAFWSEVAGLLDTAPAALAALDAVLAPWQTILETLPNGGSAYVAAINAGLQYEAAAAMFAGRLAVLAIEAEYPSFDDAQAAASALYASIHRVAELASTPGMIAAVGGLLGITYQGLVVEALHLPRRVQYPIVGAVSTLELSYRLYGDISRADEIQANNAIADPASIELDAVWVLTP